MPVRREAGNGVTATTTTTAAATIAWVEVRGWGACKHAKAWHAHSAQGLSTRFHAMRALPHHRAQGEGGRGRHTHSRMPHSLGSARHAGTPCVRPPLLLSTHAAWPHGQCHRRSRSTARPVAHAHQSFERHLAGGLCGEDVLWRRAGAGGAGGWVVGSAGGRVVGWSRWQAAAQQHQGARVRGRGRVPKQARPTPSAAQRRQRQQQQPCAQASTQRAERCSPHALPPTTLPTTTNNHLDERRAAPTHRTSPQPSPASVLP